MVFPQCQRDIGQTRTQCSPLIPLQELFEYNISSNMWIQPRSQVAFVREPACSLICRLRLPLRGTAPRVHS